MEPASGVSMTGSKATPPPPLPLYSSLTPTQPFYVHIEGPKVCFRTPRKIFNTSTGLGSCRLVGGKGRLILESRFADFELIGLEEHKLSSNRK